MHLEQFNKAIDFWIQALENYSLEKLKLKPSAESWSAGQMYMHLVDDTDFYLKQIRLCLENHNHFNKEANEKGVSFLKANDFPDMRLEGSPDNAFIPQPESKEHLRDGLCRIRAAMNSVASRIADNTLCGKTEHPGFGYLSADQWLQLAAMHLRHHVRQKTRIDKFLLTTD